MTEISTFRYCSPCISRADTQCVGQEQIIENTTNKFTDNKEMKEMKEIFSEEYFLKSNQFSINKSDSKTSQNLVLNESQVSDLMQIHPKKKFVSTQLYTLDNMQLLESAFLSTKSFKDSRECTNFTRNLITFSNSPRIVNLDCEKLAKNEDFTMTFNGDIRTSF